MSEKSKIRKANREARQERQGQKVVNWIFGILIFLAFVFMIYSLFLVS